MLSHMTHRQTIHCWCINWSYISGLLVFINLSIVRHSKVQSVSKPGSCSVISWGGGRPLLIYPLERSNLNHWKFCSLVLFTMQDDGQVQKPSNSECYTPSSEPFIIYFFIYIFNYVFSSVYILVDCKRFWRWCITLGITRFLDFVHLLVF
jgi:hypothetical protein